MTACHPAIVEISGIEAIQSRAPRIRSMREFAEQEIVVPNGPHAGSKFKCRTQPYTALFFDEVGSGRWNRIFALGPTQSGKTLTCYVVPALYHLFELREGIIGGLPDADMASDKWREDFMPVIERTRYSELVPTKGAGSRGGTKLDAVTFCGGVTLKFMSGGGGDKSRAGYTSRVLAVTETDGFDSVSETSREADKFTQLEGRLRAFGASKRLYAECTVSVELGRTWREYQEGTASRIAIRCQHCGEYVTPEREHFHWDKDADTKLEAAEGAGFCCPECAALWTDEERYAANLDALLVHRGQSIEGGKVVGDLPKTDTLGFRWSAVNNIFQTSADIAMDEWRGARSEDPDNAEKELRQFVWALPYIPDIENISNLNAGELAKKTTKKVDMGIVPGGVTQFAIGVDIGKYWIDWHAGAWIENMGHTVEYGRLDVVYGDNAPKAKPRNATAKESRAIDLDEDRAIFNTLMQLFDIVMDGWPSQSSGKLVPPECWIDSGYRPHVVNKFCREANKLQKQCVFRPIKGYGTLKKFGERQHYNHPNKRGGDVKLIGEQYHFRKSKTEMITRVDINSDYWKSFLHRRLRTPSGEPGSWNLPNTRERNGHRKYTESLTAEKEESEFDPRRGEVRRWVVIKRNRSHWLDATYYSICALHYLGARLFSEDASAAKPSKPCWFSGR